MAAPDLLDPKSATHNTKPRLSFSTKPITLTPREESEVRNQTKESNNNPGRSHFNQLLRADWPAEVLQVVATVMKWKTVTAIFLLVVLYLVIGAAVFRWLEQPHERWASVFISLLLLELHYFISEPEKLRTASNQEPSPLLWFSFWRCFC